MHLQEIAYSASAKKLWTLQLILTSRHASMQKDTQKWTIDERCRGNTSGFIQERQYERFNG